MDEGMTVGRINDKYLTKYGDDEIARLVRQYYVMFDKTGQQQGGMQINIEEVFAIKKYLNGRKFNNFLEIGVCDGGSLWLYSMLFCNKGARITAIDPVETACAKVVVENLTSRGFEICFFEAKCQDICGAFGNDFDFINLDAEHDYSAINRDFNLYINKISKGIMLIHDSNSDDGTRDFVNREIHGMYNSIDFIGLGYVASSYDKVPETIQTGTTLIEKEM